MGKLYRIPRKPTRHIAQGLHEFDRGNRYGRQAFFSFWPAMDVRTDYLINTPGPFKVRCLGLPKPFELTMAGTGTALEFRSSKSSKYQGLVANLQANGADGPKWSLAATSIRFPNKQNWTILAVVLPTGDGTESNQNDARVFAEDDGTGSANHNYMIGWVRAAGAAAARIRVRISGTTYTLVIASHIIQSDALNLVAATYDGSVLTVHHLREDGTYATPVTQTGLSGDVETDTSGSNGLAIGSSYNGGSFTNVFDGEIHCVCAVNGALGELDFRNILDDYTQLIKPKSVSYFVPSAAGFVAQLTAASVAMTPQSLNIISAFEAALTAASFATVPQSLEVIAVFEAALSAASIVITPQDLNIIAAFQAQLSAAGVAIAPQDLNLIAAFIAELSAPSVATAAQDLTITDPAFVAELTAALVEVSGLPLDITGAVADFLYVWLRRRRR